MIGEGRFLYKIYIRLDFLSLWNLRFPGRITKKTSDTNVKKNHSLSLEDKRQSRLRTLIPR